MKFVPRAPREGINVSQEHPLKEATILVAGLSIIFAVAALILVFLVDLVIVTVSPETEARILSGWSPIDIDPIAVDDSRSEMATTILGRLEVHWPDREYEFRLIVAEDDEPNALAIPGGTIVVTTGLLDQVASENELAFVLGHELGHFAMRDHLRGLGRGIAFTLLFAAVSSSEGGMDLGLAVTDLTLRGFSRDQENDADRFGLELVQAEYGHVADSWLFFERLNEIEGDTDLLQIYLSTHPGSEDRIEGIKNYAREMGWPLSGQITAIDSE